MVIQEIFGVNQHIRKVTDSFAAAGYLCLSPAIFDRVENVVWGWCRPLVSRLRSGNDRGGSSPGRARER